MKPPIKSRIIVLTDIDETLIDRGDHPDQMIQKTFRKLTIKVSLEEIAAHPDTNKLVRSKGVDLKRFWLTHNGIDDRVAGIRAGTIRPFHDAREFLEQVSYYAIVAAVTDTPLPAARPEIYSFGFDLYVSDITAFSWEARTPGKPDVSVALRALEAIEYKPQKIESDSMEALPSRDHDRDHIWVIGDKPCDIGLAENLRNYYNKNCIDTAVHSIHIQRDASYAATPGEATPDFRTFGPNPLLTAAKLILSHTQCRQPSIPMDVCIADKT